jgi:hypothetical protein
MTLGEIGIRNRTAAGDGLIRATTKTANALAFLWTWAYTTRKLGHPPTREEHAAEWKVTFRTLDRERQRFRDCFGQDVDIQEVADWLNATVDRKLLESRSRTLELPAPDFVGVLA